MSTAHSEDIDWLQKSPGCRQRLRIVIFYMAMFRMFSILLAVSIAAGWMGADCAGCMALKPLSSSHPCCPATDSHSDKHTPSSCTRHLVNSGDYSLPELLLVRVDPVSAAHAEEPPAATMEPELWAANQEAAVSPSPPPPALYLRNLSLLL